MNHAMILGAEDLRQILHLVNRLHELSGDSGARKKLLLASLRQMFAAKVGMCAVLQAERRRRDLQILTVSQSGWPPEGPPGEWQSYLQTGQPPCPLLAGLTRAVDRTTECIAMTSVRADVVNDERWYQSPHVRKVRRPAGIDETLCSVVPLGRQGLMGTIVLAREWGDPRPFTDRDKQLLDSIHSECRWVYRADLPLGSSRGRDLPPRQQQVLQYLLTGHSEKQIAAELHRSPNTVHHYVKALYRHFGVSSRSELLARWVQPRSSRQQLV